MTSSSPTSSSSSDSSLNSGSDSEESVILRKRKRTEVDEEKQSVESSSDSDSDTNATSEEDIIKEKEGETQVLSHAARRRLKNEKQKAAKQNPETITAPRRQNSVWVGNLAFKTTEQSLRDFFTRHIPGCEITRINMPGKTGQDIRGGGGTDFEGRPGGASPAGVDKTKSKSARKILAAQKQPPAPTLFFGNLGFQVTESSLKEMLEHHREAPGEKKAEDKENQKEKQWIKKVRLGTFEDSGKCKGWAFVDFHAVEDATYALINLKNHHLDGRKLVVEYASQEAVRRGGGGPQPSQKPFQRQKHRGSKQERTDDEKADPAEELTEGRPIKKTKLETDTDRRPVKPRRTKPGAALAMAKRETAAIVPFSGKRIVF
ncbi:hypothetical protein Clacol_001416 [Clathrus columnatus]|uniref:RRM domain-containing protein n=1 Tax=Clathrus columnatus TaxID=1419009 RepID=A0AAV4ZY75_9AGAM|nr:hypothetical protein Clacol_001416 [Clathrus columnatus]